jgi:uncharacterized membrane protein YkoI
MKNKKWIWAACAILVFALIWIIGFQWWAPSLSAQTLTEDDANKAAMDKYPGEIIKTTKSEGEYQVDMQLKTGIYHIRINAKSGEVNSIERDEKALEIPEEKAPKQLTQKEIEALISSQGDLESIDFVQEKDFSYYKAVVSKNNEKITLKLDPYTGNVIDSTKEPTRTMTENEAIAIAEEHVKGSVDDVDFYQPSDQTPYYLVEVELKDDREVVVQIDAYTREVKTVSWEDHGDDESDDDNESE